MTSAIESGCAEGSQDINVAHLLLPWLGEIVRGRPGPATSSIDQYVPGAGPDDGTSSWPRTVLGEGMTVFVDVTRACLSKLASSATIGRSTELIWFKAQCLRETCCKGELSGAALTYLIHTQLVWAAKLDVQIAVPELFVSSSRLLPRLASRPRHAANWPPVWLAPLSSHLRARLVKAPLCSSAHERLGATSPARITLSRRDSRVPFRATGSVREEERGNVLAASPVLSRGLPPPRK